MVQDMDLEIATYALKQSYDEEILRDGIMNPQHLGDTYFRYLLQQALPKFLDPERKVVMKRTFLSKSMNGMGGIEGLTDSAYPITHLPQAILMELVEDSVSHTLWDRESTGGLMLGEHIWTQCVEK